MRKQKSQVMQEVDKAVRQVLLRSTKKMPQVQGEGHNPNQKKRFRKKDLRAALKRVQNIELDSQQRRDALNVYLLMKNSNEEIQVVNEKQSAIDEDRADRIRQFRRDQEQFDMYNDPVMNYSGLR